MNPKFRELEEFAKSHGFSLHSHSGDRIMWDFVNTDGIHLEFHILDVPLKSSMTLVYIHRLLKISTGELSYPNKNFHIFLSQMKMAVALLTQERQETST